jgi:two-component sensor histidine kinase
MPPAEIKESFGSRLIKSAVSHDLQGTCDYRFGTGGLSCTLSMRF